ncbi:class I SAM-dependent methyltransferase [bacterium]|nr:class I SAM-dependent methyltransferase [bacterium]
MNPTELLKEYRKAHTHPTMCLMPGNSIQRHTNEFVNFCYAYKPKTVLDYGCGKGLQWTQRELHKEGNIHMPTLYDPGVPGLDKKPNGVYDSVLCTDVMEHIHQEECDAVLEEVFNYARHSVFFTISCNPAKKHFPDGTNYHVNCKPEEWWFATIKRLKPKHLKVWLIFPSFSGIIKYDKEETR